MFVVAFWSLTQEVAGSSSFNDKYSVTEFSEFRENIWENSIVLGNCDVFSITEITLIQDQQNGDMLLLTSESFLVTCIANQN